MGRDRELGELQVELEVWRLEDPVAVAKAKKVEFSDEDLKDFCEKLSKSEIELDDWTAKFVADMAGSRYKCSDKQRAKIEKLIGEYRDRLKW